MGDTSEQRVDFFISRAGADAAFAAEITRILEDDGNRVVLQQWDFANRNFLERMHWALSSGARVLALLSADYLASQYCEAEWQSVIASDPLNRQGRLIVIRVGECVPTGLLTALPYWDLVPVGHDWGVVRDIVRAAIKGRHKLVDTPLRPYWREAQTIVHREIRPTPSFTGRTAELSAVEAALASAGAAAVTQAAAVLGMGGIGKSVLAREYAYRFRDRYAGVWWLDAAKAKIAQGFEGVESGLLELGAIFIRGLDQAEDRAKTARLTLQFLADGGFEKPWLLIYDNVDDARVLREWSPEGNAHVLLTTRLRGWPGTVRAIEIEKWPMADAIEYLLRESRGDLGTADAERISEAVGCLPLALSHAAAYLRARPIITAAGYVSRLTRRMNQAPADAEYSSAVLATFQAALDEAESQAPGARAVLSLAAFFAPDGIPEELFRQPPSSYPPALAGLVADPVTTEEAFGALAHLSLIDFDSGRQTFSVHPLVQAAARDALAAEAATWAESALATTFAAFPEPEFNTWPLCERLVPHARAVASHVTADSRPLAVLLARTADYLRERAEVAEVAPLYERAFYVFNRLAAADPGNASLARDVSVSLNKVGDVRVAEGDRGGALEAYEKSLEIARGLAAADPDNAGWEHDVSVSLERIGDVRVAKRDRNGALKAYEESLEIRKRLAAADPGWLRDVSVSLDRIGGVRVAEGDHAGALKVYEESLAIRERLFAANPGNAGWARDVSVSLERIGAVRVAEGDRGGALKAYEGSQDIRRRLAAADPGSALSAGPIETALALLVKPLDWMGLEDLKHSQLSARRSVAKRPLNEGKLILVGRGSVGKTSLVKRLVENEFDDRESKTQGIRITRWFLSHRENTFRLNIWDFGGQEIMHATHQFFLTERSLYLLVLNGREGGEDVDAEYWLKHIESFGGESPVIVVQNKINEHLFDLNYKGLLRRYPQIRGFVQTDCKDHVGLRELRELIESVVIGMPEVQMQLPADWFTVKERLESLDAEFLGYEGFVELCAQYGVKAESDRDTLGFVLHCLGIALSYRDDPRLRETSVLKPQWVTQGIYDILHAKKLALSQGEFELNDLQDILLKKRYPIEKHLFLVELMRKFSLCFPFHDNADRHLVPELLAKQEPEDVAEF